jgi:hypothetical protein
MTAAGERGAACQMQIEPILHRWQLIEMPTEPLVRRDVVILAAGLDRAF